MYTIFCDSACDLNDEFLKKYGVKKLDFPHALNGEDQKPLQKDEDYKEYYKKVREGAISSTSSINEYRFREVFEPELKKGNDVLYIHLSSSLTSTFNNLNPILEDFKKQYPDRKMYFVDSLGVSTQIGLLIYLAVKKLKNGESIESVYNFLNDKKFKIACYFVCRDLSYLVRGGRLSKTKAVIGSLLGVKPLLKCDAEGKIIKIEMLRGKVAIMKRFIKLLQEEGENVLDYPISIVNSDCLADAEELKKEIEKYLGNSDNIWINNLGTTIGTHCGPDTLGLIFHSRTR